MGDSKTIAGMDYQFAEHIKTLEKYGDQLNLIPDKHRMMMKFLGPMYDQYIKLSFSLQSVKKTFGGMGKDGSKATEDVSKGAKKADKSLGSMVKSVGLLGMTFGPLVAVLGATKALFGGILMGMMPLIGIIFGVMAAVMLLVAIFDQGGGSLRAWLTDLPLVGDAFGVVQAGVDKVKGALGAVDWEGTKAAVGGVASSAGQAFGPVWDALVTGLGDTIQAQKDRIIGIWESLKENVALPEFNAEEFFGGIAEAMTTAVEVFFEVYNAIYDAIFILLEAIIEAGIIQAVIDGFLAIWESFEMAYDLIMGAFGDGGGTVGDIISFVMDLWNMLIDFLVTSGVFGFIGDLIRFVGELIGFIIVVVAAIIAIVIKFVGIVWPFVKPYYAMLLNAIGFVVTYVMMVVRIFIGIVRIVMALLTGNTDKAGKIFSGLKDMIIGSFKAMWNYAKGFINSFINLVWPLFSLINKGIKLASKVPGLGWVKKLTIKKPQFEKGGVASGPRSGYPVELHGTEAVVPLPDGRSIPVTMKGMGGGGGDTNITINVNGVSGDGRKLARQISDEVARAFRTKSRGSGLSRGL
jgi:phage-related protein